MIFKKCPIIQVNKYNVLCIDCVGSKPKNFQKLNTIEIFFGVTSENSFIIQYNFHKIDYEIWVQVLSIHKEGVKEYSIYDTNGDLIDEKNIKDSQDYYFFTIISKEFNLYRNIYLIMFLEKGEWNNMDEHVKMNT